MSKYTPGPWIAHVSMVNEESGNDVMLVRSTDPLRGISSMELETEEDAANAHLISAAPELLAALKRVLAHYRYIPDGVDFQDAWAAIRKAEGRS